MKERELTEERLRQIVAYNPETGVFTWKARVPEDFISKKGGDTSRVCNSWNARLAGKEAGWYDKDGYLIIEVCGTKFRAHRLAWFLTHSVWPSDEIDHRNLVRDDNRLVNLREGDKSDNGANRTVSSRNKSGLKGVSLGSNGRWQAFIGKNKKNRYLGTFDTPEEAHEAWWSAAKELHGEFARAA